MGLMEGCDSLGSGLSFQCSRVDLLCVVGVDFLDDSLLGKLNESSSGERSVDLESVDENGDRDQTVRSDLLEEFVILVFVEHDGVVAILVSLCLSLRLSYHDDRDMETLTPCP